MNIKRTKRDLVGRVNYQMPKCIVCGRSFPDGQGIVLSRRDLYLSFHSSRCASRFLRRLIMDSEDIDCLEKQVNTILKEFEEIQEKKKVTKKI